MDTVWDLTENPAEEVTVYLEETKFGSKITVFGMGKSQGRWLEQLELAGVSEKQIARVEATEWRQRLWPGLKMSGKTSDIRRTKWKIQALTWAKTYCGVDAATDDEAEALCMGRAYLVDSGNNAENSD